MLRLLILFLFSALFSCQEKTNSVVIENLPHTKYLLDSTLQILEKLTITKGFQIIHSEYELVNGVMKLTKRQIDF